jgi:hypothetical protein
MLLRKGQRTYRVRAWRPITSLKQMYVCATKFVHHDFLSAMRHAERLRAKEPSRFFNIYPCRFCDGLHVGGCKRSPEITEDFEGWRDDGGD